MTWNWRIQRKLDAWYSANNAGDAMRAATITAELRADGIVFEGSPGGVAWWRVG